MFYTIQPLPNPELPLSLPFLIFSTALIIFYHHPAYLTYAEYIMRNAGLEETQAGIKIAGRNINNLRYADDTTLMAERHRIFLCVTLDESERGE